MKITDMPGAGLRRKMENFGVRIIEYKFDLTKDQIDAVANISGVYALYHGSTLQYIGKSNSDIRKRINDHLREEEIPFSTFSWFNLYSGQVDKAEKLLVETYKPAYNTNTKKIN